MNLSTQKRMAADVLDCGENKIWIDPGRQSDVGDAITKADIRRLIQEGAIKKKEGEGQSRGRARKKGKQKERGRRSGHGSRKGGSGARQDEKEKWMSGVRAQRKILRKLKGKDKVELEDYRNLYRMVKGGRFGSKKQLKDWIENQNLLKEGESIE